MQALAPTFLAEIQPFPGVMRPVPVQHPTGQPVKPLQLPFWPLDLAKEIPEHCYRLGIGSVDLVFGTVCSLVLYTLVNFAPMAL